jgi:hypothetical protein
MRQASAEDRVTPRRPLHRATAVLAAVALALASAACGHKDKGPTAAQAGDQLAEHLSAIAADQGREAAGKLELTSRVENSLPCGKGKESRQIVVAGAFHKYLNRSVRGVLAQVYGAAFVQGYKSYYYRQDEGTAKARDAKSRTSLIIVSPEVDRVSLYGYTDCLRVK